MAKSKSSVPSVAIIGAGMAGLTCALRLLERGFDVKVFERGEYVGGQFGVQAEAPRKRPRGRSNPRRDLHEHCYHMFLNWYHNFWDIAQDLDVLEQFEPHHSIHHVRQGEWPRTRKLTDVGSPAHFASNLCSGLLPISDMYLYAYSLTDLLSQPFSRDSFRDQFSVNGFMRSRPYTTDLSAQQHQLVMAKAFACPTYRTSAASYKHFMRYGFRMPSPMMWMLKDNCYEAFLRPFVERIEKLRRELGGASKTTPCIKTRVEVSHIEIVDGGIGVRCCSIRENETEDVPEPLGSQDHATMEYFDYLISAVSPDALSRLLDRSARHDPVFYEAASQLFEVKQLHSEAIASLDVFFNKRLADVPKGIVVLLKAKYDLTLVDNSQLWASFEDEPNTCLNVVASSFDSLSGLSAEEAKRHVVKELSRFIPFDPVEDVDWERTFIRKNAGEHIFINDVGSWHHRPKAVCDIDRLFLAGDFCQTFVDVTTLEGATVSGLNAVNALCEHAGVGDPIPIKTPDYYPEAAMLALKMWGAPAAFAAKFWSETRDRLVGD